MKHPPINGRAMYLSLISDVDQNVADIRASMERAREHALATGTLAAHHRYIAERLALADEINCRRMYEAALHDCDDDIPEHDTGGEG